LDHFSSVPEPKTPKNARKMEEKKKKEKKKKKKKKKVSRNPYHTG
jgi:hypothetical protein